MLTPLAGLPVSAADSARAAASVYTASLLATGPIVAAVVAAIALRRASAEGRVLVWRAAVVMLLIAFAGRLLPMRLTGWSVPSVVAAPLIALGRVRVADAAARGNAHDSFAAAWIQILLITYAIGVVGTLLPTIAGSWRARRLLRRALSLDTDAGWAAELADARARIVVRRAVGLFRSVEIDVPMTLGVIRPVIVVPAIADGWSGDERRMILRHELAHVLGGDWAFGIVARAACSVFWFHPGAWWIAASLRRDAEQVADDRVIASGVARSDYAELLIAASSADGWQLENAVAFSGRGSIRSRLAAILDLRHDVRPVARRWAFAATAACVLSTAPLGAVELAPTRAALTTLMRDSRWESRAYAVIGLAHRADSVAAARTAAELDPSPRVRAWARYALGLEPDVSAASPAR